MVFPDRSIFSSIAPARVSGLAIRGFGIIIGWYGIVLSDSDLGVGSKDVLDDLALALPMLELESLRVMVEDMCDPAIL
jgi:hypothetical protein